MKALLTFAIAHNSQNTYYNEESIDDAVNNYIFLWYNHVRPHLHNGGLTPFEARNL